MKEDDDRELSKVFPPDLSKRGLADHPGGLQFAEYRLDNSGKPILFLNKDLKRIRLDGGAEYSYFEKYANCLK
jgi:hypothetical protein